MPRTCTVCRHEDRQAIEEALLSRQSYRHIAQRFDTSTSALQRHKAHLSVSLVKAEQAREVAKADTLLGQLEDLQARTLRLLEKAERTKDWRTAISGVREARGNLELISKLTGELARAERQGELQAGGGHNITINAPPGFDLAVGLRAHQARASQAGPRLDPAPASASVISVDSNG